MSTKVSGLYFLQNNKYKHKHRLVILIHDQKTDDAWIHDDKEGKAVIYEDLEAAENDLKEKYCFPNIQAAIITLEGLGIASHVFAKKK